MESPPAVVRLAASSAIILAQLLLATYQAVRAGWLSKIRMHLLDPRAALGRLRRLLQWSAAPLDSTDKVVQEHLLAVRHAALHSWVRAFSWSFFGLCCLALMQGMNSQDDFVTRWQAVLGAVAYLLLYVLQLKPGLMKSPWFADLSCLLVTSAALLFMFPGICHPRTVPWLIMTVLTALDGWSITVLSSWRAVVAQTVFFAGFCAAWHVNEMLDLGSYIPPAAFLAVAVHGLSVIVLAIFMNGIMETRIRSVLETQVIRGQQAAGKSLLNIFYEVVLETDASFRITTGLPELQSFLRRGPGEERQGTRLIDFFRSDQEYFQLQDSVGREDPAACDSLAGVTHATLHDGNSDGLDVELFHFKFAGIAGSQQCMFGIREFGDASAEIYRTDDAGLPADFTEAGTAGKVWVAFNGFSDNPSIVQCSDTFRKEMGPLGPGLLLRDLLGVEPLKDLLLWLETVANKHLSGREDLMEEARHANSFDARFRPQGRPGLRVHATCRVDLDQCALEVVGKVHVLPVVLGLHGLERARVTCQGGAGSAGGSTRGTPNTASGEHLGCLVPERLGKPVSL